MSDQSLSPLHQAYRILARLSHEAWRNPLDVPMPLAMMLMHARDFVGERLHRELGEQTDHASTQADAA